MHATQEIAQRDRISGDRAIQQRVQVLGISCVPHSFNRHWRFPCYTR